MKQSSNFLGLIHSQLSAEAITVSTSWQLCKCWK